MTTNTDEKQEQKVVASIVTEEEKTSSSIFMDDNLNLTKSHSSMAAFQNNAYTALHDDHDDPFNDDSGPTQRPTTQKEEIKDELLAPGPKAFDYNHLLSLDDLANEPKSKDYPCHVLLVVHGIGARPHILTKNLGKIRHTIELIRKTKKDYFQCPIHVKMIDWKSSLCPNVKELIEKVTLQSNKKQRNIVNQVPTDLLFYVNQEHSRQILDEVVLQANHTYEKLKERYNDVRISLVGHSLGTVILNDLLTKRGGKPESPTSTTPNEKASTNGNGATGTNGQNTTSTKEKALVFNFNVENIFFIGSPLGMFLSLNKTKLILLDEAKFCKGFYNIFHPNDLLAYRIEPLIDGYIETPPYEIPYIKNDGLKKHKEKTSDKAGYGIISFCVSRNKNGIPEDRNIITKKEFKRYDYVLQEGYFESMVESLGIIGGHWVYWDSQDLFYFILKKIHSNIY